MNMANTINTPTWLAERPELGWNEKILYSVYHYFTFYGKRKSCTYTNKELGEQLGLSEKQIQYAKQKLKAFGYIEFSGIKVVAQITEKDLDKKGGDDNLSKGDKFGMGGDNYCPESTKNGTHNKENKEENKKNKIPNIEGTYIEGNDKGKRAFVFLEDNDLISSSTCEEEIYPDDAATNEESLQNELQNYISDIDQRAETNAWVRYLGEQEASVFEKLIIAYRWERNDPLPLLGYIQDHPTDEVYQAIYNEFNDEHRQWLANFCKSIGFTPTTEE